LLNNEGILIEGSSRNMSLKIWNQGGQLIQIMNFVEEVNSVKVDEKEESIISSRPHHMIDKEVNAHGISVLEIAKNATKYSINKKSIEYKLDSFNSISEDSLYSPTELQSYNSLLIANMYGESLNSSTDRSDIYPIFIKCSITDFLTSLALKSFNIFSIFNYD
jgi:hypothetical protein